MCLSMIVLKSKKLFVFFIPSQNQADTLTTFPSGYMVAVHPQHSGNVLQMMS